MLKLVIFDYDGLLVESEHIAYKAEKAILEKYHRKLTKELFIRYLGFSVRDTIKGYIAQLNMPISAEDFLKERNAYLDLFLESELRLKPGANDLLKYFKQKNIKSVIASSGTIEYIEKGLDVLKIRPFFINITSVSEVDRGKPQPDLFLKALEKNNTNANEAIVLEDAISGITAAKVAKIFCVAVPPVGVDLQAYHIADLVLGSLAEIIPLYENGLLGIN